MRRAAKIDSNQVEIVAALRRAGAVVQSLAAVGNGCPDLLVGFLGRTFLMEIKDGAKVKSAQALNPEQVSWHQSWRGGSLSVVTSITDALRVLLTDKK